MTAQLPSKECTTHAAERRQRDELPCPWCVIDELKRNRSQFAQRLADCEISLGTFDPGAVSEYWLKYAPGAMHVTAHETPASKVVAECSPCPFCGERPFVLPAYNAPDWWIVNCVSKTCQAVPTLERKGRNAAIAAWNKRPSSKTRACAACDLGITRERGRHYAQVGDSWPCGAEPPGSYRDATGELVLPAQKAFAVCLKAVPQQCIRPSGHEGDCDVVKANEEQS